MKLIKSDEAINTLSIKNEKELKNLIKEGLPCLKAGNDYRFIEYEITTWFKSYLPEQERLEKEFIDEKGRTIEEYETIEGIIQFLQFHKNKIYRLCSKGMPFEKVGKKRFFNKEDIVNYLRFTPKDITKSSLFVIDGSYNCKTKNSGTGIILKTDKEIKGYSFVHMTEHYKNQPHEYLAILDALHIAKKEGFKNIIIATDQIDFVSKIKENERFEPKWAKKESGKSLFDEIYNIIDELKDSVSFIYTDNLIDKTHYQNAHTLSRYYDNKVITEIKENKLLPGIKKISEKVEKKALTENKLKEKNKIKLKIKFNRIEDNFSWFDVTLAGKAKKIKYNTNKAVKAALNIAKGYVHSHENPLDVEILTIPTFKEEMNNALVDTKQKERKSLLKLFEYMKQEAKFTMYNDYRPYIPQYERKII